MATQIYEFLIGMIISVLVEHSRTLAIPSLFPGVDYSKQIAIYPPAEADYPPIDAFSKSVKLPESSKLIDRLIHKPNNHTSLSLHNFDRENAMSDDDNVRVMVSSAMHPSHYDEQNQFAQSESISNPASYYLHGAHFQKIKKPPCRLLDCIGPLPNDGSIRVQFKPSTKREQCQQAFIELNGCVSNYGYPVGMVCTVCCTCTRQFVTEMRKTRAFGLGINNY